MLLMDVWMKQHVIIMQTQQQMQMILVYIQKRMQIVKGILFVMTEFNLL